MARVSAPRFGLLFQVAAASALAILVLGLALFVFLRSAAEADALADAGRRSDLIAQLRLLPELKPADLERGLSRDGVKRLDRVLGAEVVRNRISQVKVWSPSGVVVYSTNRALIGRRFARTHELEEALDGRTESEVTEPGSEAESASDRDQETQLEAYVPLRFQARARPAGAFEIYMPYKPIASRIEARMRETVTILLLGLLLLYAVLFRIVARASRTLREQAATNEHQARHDALTGLPNRTYFRESAERVLQERRRAGGRAAVMIMDLNRFKEINDALGHPTGDALLCQIGPRLAAALGDSGVVARLGGDEFAVILPEVVDAADAGATARELARVLERPFPLADLTLHIEASVGVALFPDHGDDVDTMLQRADVAMYAAKRGHQASEIYSPDCDRCTPDRVALLGELRGAIAADDLVLHYQPKLNLQSGRVAGVEALVRWNHPTRGLIPPGEFVPLAEHSELIRPLTSWVLDAALRQCRAWQDGGLDLGVAVNLSAANVGDEHLPGDVERLLEVHGVAPHLLQLEVTESMMMIDPTRGRRVLDRLRYAGVSIAVDDFGTGLASLAYLKRLPVSELKIDGSFVKNMATDESDATIVGSIIALGHELGLRVTAEGVEATEALVLLDRLDCDYAQGFHLCHPLPAGELTERLRQTTGNGSTLTPEARPRSRAPVGRS